MNYDFSVKVWGKNKLGNIHEDKILGSSIQLCSWVSFPFIVFITRDLFCLALQGYYTHTGALMDIAGMNSCKS